MADFYPYAADKDFGAEKIRQSTNTVKDVPFSWGRLYQQIMEYESQSGMSNAVLPVQIYSHGKVQIMTDQEISDMLQYFRDRQFLADVYQKGIGVSW